MDSEEETAELAPVCWQIPTDLEAAEQEIADLRSKMRELHGDKVRLKPVPLAGGGLLSRLRRLPGFRAITNDGFAFPPSFADDAISAVEARALWSRFGL